MGNKVDLESNRAVTFAEGKAFAEQHGLVDASGNVLFAETSALQPDTIKSAFLAVAEGK